MAAQAIGELPTETLPTVELPNPVIPSDMEFSKSNFREQMESAKNTPIETETPDPKPDQPLPEELTPRAPKVESQPEVTPEPATTADKVEIPPETPASKATLPEELLTGKKPEPKVDEDVQTLLSAEIKKGAKQDAIDNFKALREYSAKVIQERNDQIEELKAKTSEGASRHEVESERQRREAAEAKAKEFEQTIEKLAFTESPKFKQMLADESHTLATAKSYFEGTEINPDIIEYAARLNGAQRIKVLRESGADAELIAAVSPYLAQFDTIQRYKTGALENWKVEAAQQGEAYKAQQDAQAEQRRKAEDEVWSQVQIDLSNLVPYRKFDKNDPWNSRADELLAKAKTVYNGDGVDLKEVGTIIGKGMAYDALDEVRVALTEELNRVVQENAKLKSAKPGASNGQVAAASNNANLSPMEQSKARFNQEMGRTTPQ